MVPGEVKDISDPRRQYLTDEDFIFGWAEASLPKFQPLFAPIELLRKRDAKVFYADRETGTSE